jgi:ribonuclease P protein component
VAYSIRRQAGGAVVRNRLRRRERAIVTQLARELPAGAYVVSSDASATTLGFEELKVAMSRALQKATTASQPLAGGADR